MPPTSPYSQTDALHHLYRNHHGWLVGWLRKKLNCSFHADDVAQDTFVNVLRSRQLDDIQEPRAFLTVIARRELYNFWRRRELEKSYLEALAHLPPVLSSSQEDMALMREAIELIDRHLDGLPSKVKQVFLLSRLEDMTHVAIAGYMGISVATVERYMKQAIVHCYLARKIAGRE